MNTPSMFKKRLPNAGARPGTLVIPEDAHPPQVHVMRFGLKDLTEEDVEDIESLGVTSDEDTVTWVDIQGFGDEKLIRRIGTIFKLHSLVMEEVVNVPQRPKAMPYDEQMLIIVRMVSQQGTATFDMEQVSIVLGKNFVLTFQEHPGDVLDPVRNRIRRGGGPIRREGADYVAYAIFDTIVDGYYPVLENIGDHLERLESVVIDNPVPRVLQRLNQMKNRLTNLRRVMWPQREAASRLCREEHPLIDPNVRVFLRDTHDHCVQTTEVVEMYREMVTGLMNTYLSAVANRTNEVMKVLTIVATIFIPLTFLAGIYGMNFEYMPELHVEWAYPLIWITMFVVAGGMIAFFWRKGWVGPGSSADEDDIENEPLVS